MVDRWWVVGDVKKNILVIGLGPGQAPCTINVSILFICLVLMVTNFCDENFSELVLRKRQALLVYLLY